MCTGWGDLFLELYRSCFVFSPFQAAVFPSSIRPGTLKIVPEAPKHATRTHPMLPQLSAAPHSGHEVVESPTSRDPSPSRALYSTHARWADPCIVGAGISKEPPRFLFDRGGYD